ncbi:hypothetical protein H4R35_007185, partial [Dimargaris xerosporica]
MKYPQLRQSQQDLRKVIPFAFIALILPESIPFLIVFAPGLIPSTCVTANQRKTGREKIKKVRQDIHDTVVEAAARANGPTFDDFKTLKGIIQVADKYQWHLDIHGLGRPALVNFSRFIGLGALGTTNQLRQRLLDHLEFIQHEDKAIMKEGLQSLSLDEAKVACEDRGISTHDLTEDRLRALLSQTIRLNTIVDPRPLPPILNLTARIYLQNSLIK